ncbi:ABC transporter ATP-binding protein [Paenibacillus sp. J31TS4]|uniref:ABC transporter ATP-binding protein n=1 Tax=Paenibacillus sp. J31TS4 TaxID=2807195 RepID=UPI001AFD275D|nr:ABC transporter ATP-binding protein [Paenibacillus sp. J31TS4]GIP37769.1 ABC transporter ATP-binding protein [Paenibacillus sp. J31TS4]
MTAAIQLEQVTKVYKGKTAVDRLSLTIERGSVVALLGPNGAGKTTTVSLMLGLQQPTSGQARLLGSDPRDRGVRDRIGAMLQEVSVIDNLTVEETIGLFRSYYRRPLPLDRLLRMAGLEESRRKFASSLSGGQKRRLGFALAAAGDPDVLFLDEPTVGMDVEARRLFWASIREMAGQGRTIVLTTHYLEEADQTADRVIVMRQGSILADGTPESIKAAAARRTLAFTAAPGLTSERLLTYPGVTDVEWKGHRVRIACRDTDRLLFALLKGNERMKDIEITAGGLEDAFETLLREAN